MAHNVTQGQPPDDSPDLASSRSGLPEIENPDLRSLIEAINRLDTSGLGETPPANAFQAGWDDGGAHGPA